MVTQAVSATAAETVAVTGNVPAAVPAVYSPLDSIVPPEAVQVGVSDIGSPR